MTSQDEFEREVRGLRILDDVRWPSYYKIAGYIPMSREMQRELYEPTIGPWHGPAVPMPLALWRSLRGHPAGGYRRAP